MSDQKGCILGLAHIGVRVRDMDASIAFYTDILGFKLTARQTLGTGGLPTGPLPGNCPLLVSRTAAAVSRSPCFSTLPFINA